MRRALVAALFAGAVASCAAAPAGRAPLPTTSPAAPQPAPNRQGGVL